MAKEAKQTPRSRLIPDRSAASKMLCSQWTEVLEDEVLETTPVLQSLINSSLVTIRYCLPTQLLGKLVDPSLDALCLQAKEKGGGKWDPRSFAKAVISPWVLQNQKVLGSSADPYVGNPLRRPRLDEGLEQMQDIDQWEALCNVLSEVQKRDDPDYTEKIFKRTLVAIKNRLQDQDFVYVVPNRVSLEQTKNLVEVFLAEKSGGDRGLAVVAALFEMIKERIGLYTEVQRGVINAADAATGSVADLECIGIDGEIILAVEVKERKIGDADVQIAVAKARLLNVREFLFCTEGIIAGENAEVRETFSKAWASGTNLYHATVGELLSGTLPILGEKGILEFVVQVGRQLDKFSTQPKHRKVWKSLLDAL